MRRKLKNGMKKRRRKKKVEKANQDLNHNQARREGADALLDAMETVGTEFFLRLSKDSTTTHPTDVLNTVTGRDIDSLVSNTQENASVEEICLQGPNELPQGDVVTNVLEINARDVVVHGL